MSNLLVPAEMFEPNYSRLYSEILNFAQKNNTWMFNFVLEQDKVSARTKGKLENLIKISSLC